jgi:D-alanyl-D-alanine dipeptidase
MRRVREESGAGAGPAAAEVGGGAPGPRGRGRLASAVLALALGACAGPGAPAPRFVSLVDLAPQVALDLRYAGPDNFVGAPIDGYEEPVCLLTGPAARALARVDADLRAEGLALVVFDCYRPQRAVDHFARWASDPADTATRAEYYPDVPKAELFERGYIARRSSHSRGSTVDVGLAGAGPDGALRALDLGTPFDFFDPRSRTDAPDVAPAARILRLRLRSAMERRGFRNLPQEWWHYTLAGEPYPDTAFDVPVRASPAARPGAPR